MSKTADKFISIDFSKVGSEDSIVRVDDISAIVFDSNHLGECGPCMISLKNGNNIYCFETSESIFEKMKSVGAF